MDTRKKLAVVGEALYGERWINRLAALIGMSSGHLCDVLSGRRSGPKNIDNKLVVGLRKHADDLTDRLDTVERLISQLRKEEG